MADLNYYLGEKYVAWWDSKRPLEAGWYGISTLFLQESIYDLRRADNTSYRWLKNKKPDYQVGTSILIYYVNKTEAETAQLVRAEERRIASAVEQATLGTLGTQRAALSLGKYSSKMLR